MRNECPVSRLWFAVVVGQTKKFVLRRLALLICAPLFAPLPAFADSFDSDEPGCFAELINMMLKPVAVGKTVPVLFVCETMKAAVYSVKAMESKNKIQMEKAESVCEEKKKSVRSRISTTLTRFPSPKRKEQPESPQ